MKVFRFSRYWKDGSQIAIGSMLKHSMKSIDEKKRRKVRKGPPYSQVAD